MWSLECKHQMLTHDGRRTTTDDGQPLTTIAHHEHFVLRWAKKVEEFQILNHINQLNFNRIPQGFNNIVLTKAVSSWNLLSGSRCKHCLSFQQQKNQHYKPIIGACTQNGKIPVPYRLVHGQSVGKNPRGKKGILLFPYWHQHLSKKCFASSVFPAMYFCTKNIVLCMKKINVIVFHLFFCAW